MAGVSPLATFSPLLPKQILLTNLLTDFPEMTIATDNVDNEWWTIGAGTSSHSQVHDDLRPAQLSIRLPHLWLASVGFSRDSGSI